jgi:hypothetical protein
MHFSGVVGSVKLSNLSNFRNVFDYWTLQNGAHVSSRVPCVQISRLVAAVVRKNSHTEASCATCNTLTSRRGGKKRRHSSPAHPKKLISTSDQQAGKCTALYRTMVNHTEA